MRADEPEAKGGGIQEDGAAPAPPSRRGVMTRRSLLASTAATGMVLGVTPAWFAGAAPRPVRAQAVEHDPLRRDFRDPPQGSEAGTYWWWLNGAASEASITADLQAMKTKGISYALLFSAGGGAGPLAQVPEGPPFMSEPWRRQFRFAVREAARLDMELGVNICSGWNCGGPWVGEDDAVKDLVWEETQIDGPGHIERDLPAPARFLPTGDAPSPGSREQIGFIPAKRLAQIERIERYRDIAVLACRERRHGVWQPDDMEDLTPHVRDGRLRWQAPAGRWTVLRFGYAVRKYAGMNVEIGYHLVKASGSPNPPWEIDPMSAGAMDRHFAHTGARLADDAGALTGETLKYLHIDSWELGIPTWTPLFKEEFRARRGYDPVRYLPGLVGKTLGSPEIGRRFAADFRRTIADLTARNYYGRLSELCHQHGLTSQSEAGGPFYTQYIDAMECQGAVDVPMAEFWSSREQMASLDVRECVSAPFFHSAEKEYPSSCFGSVKQAASAAHVYGRRICQAESYTSTNADWSADPYFLKSLGDRAFCLGLTRQILSMYVLQPASGKPGYEWPGVGTHFDRNVTWWPLIDGWLSYLARCQHLLRHGSFAADILYFAGESVPGFVLLDRKPVAGHDFDVINAQALLTRAVARDGRLVLPDGVGYRYLVIPDGAADSITPAVLDKIRQLVEGGVTLVGPRPAHSLGLSDYPNSERRIGRQADALWGAQAADHGARHVGAGRVIWGRALEEIMRTDGLEPDVELRGLPAGAELDWIHRHDTHLDIYFLANLTAQPVTVDAVFRVSGRMPELWDPVTAEVRDLPEFRHEGARTRVPLKFAPKQSLFLLFRRAAGRHLAPAGPNFPALRQIARLAGPWEVGFDVEWGGPASVIFQELEDWSQRPEEGIRYYSGKATYRKTFDLPAGADRGVFLDLGEVKNVARVRLNGESLGTVWTAPWRVDVTGIAHARGNTLEIDVVNLWPNRLIGDGLLPKDRRRTHTNVTGYDPSAPHYEYCDVEADCGVERAQVQAGEPPKLLRSGLLGPVTLLGEYDG